MSLKSTATAIYGFLVGVGGIIGFIKSGSAASLVMGSIFSLLILGCAFAMYKQSILAHFCAVILCSLLTFFFAYRFSLAFKFMPAGLMLILSLCLLTLLCLKQRSVATFKKSN